MKDLILHLAKLIGEPINNVSRVPAEVSLLANTFLVEPGEIVYGYVSEDSNTDSIFLIGDSTLHELKITPVTPTLLTPLGKRSNLDYVLVNEILSNDVNALARRKASMARGLDKLMLKEIFDGITGGGIASQAYVAESANSDIYEIIMGMKTSIEDVGDGFELFVGSTISSAIDMYDKNHANSFNYSVGIKKMLADNNIKVTKIFGSVTTGSMFESGVDTDLLAEDSMVLIAVNSHLAEGKPINVVRRKISSAASLLLSGTEIVDAQERLLCSVAMPMPVSGDYTIACGCFAYAQWVITIQNKYAVSYMTGVASYL